MQHLQKTNSHETPESGEVIVLPPVQVRRRTPTFARRINAILQRIIEKADEAYAAKVELVGADAFHQFERNVMLQNMDTHWREHLAALDHLRQGIHLRGYAQKNPKQEYKREAFELFRQLIDMVKNEVTKTLMTVQVQSPTQLGQAAEDMEQRAESIANVTYSAPTETGEIEQTVADASDMPAVHPSAFAGISRNDPCPCGSGKKYKHCHGKLQ